MQNPQQVDVGREYYITDGSMSGCRMWSRHSAGFTSLTSCLSVCVLSTTREREGEREWESSKINYISQQILPSKICNFLETTTRYANCQMSLFKSLFLGFRGRCQFYILDLPVHTIIFLLSKYCGSFPTDHSQWLPWCEDIIAEKYRYSNIEPSRYY